MNRTDEYLVKSICRIARMAGRLDDPSVVAFAALWEGEARLILVLVAGSRPRAWAALTWRWVAEAVRRLASRLYWRWSDLRGRTWVDADGLRHSAACPGACDAEPCLLPGEEAQ